MQKAPSLFVSHGETTFAPEKSDFCGFIAWADQSIRSDDDGFK